MFKKNKVTLADKEKEMLKQDMRLAIQEKKAAEESFDLADREYVDAAITRMRAAELQLEYVYKRCKIYEETTGERIMGSNEFLITDGIYQDLDEVWNHDEE